MTEQKNAREFSRIEIPVTVRLSMDGDKIVSSSKVVNISMNGMQLCAEHTMSVGDQCQVEVLFGDPDNALSIFAEGKIARIISDGLAVNFESIELESFDHLKNLISYNAGDVDQVEREFAEHLGLHRR